MSDTDYHEGWHDALQSALRNAAVTRMSGGDLQQFMDWLHDQLQIAKEDLE